ncbi:MAG: septal ring lytic transglycosylase RlpA family protein [Bdellovibrionota bacterium]
MKTKKAFKIFLFLSTFSFLVSCHPSPVPSTSASVGNAQMKGYASWYGGKFHGRKTASGEIYDQYKLTAAHKTLPFDTWVRVTNVDNGMSVVVKVNDRGPFVRGRIIDLSRRAAEKIDMVGTGTARVRLTVEKKPSNKIQHMTYIQVGSFAHKDSAQHYADDVDGVLGDINIGIHSENGLHKVWLGPFATESSARRKLSLLQSKKIDGFILHP